MKTETVRRIELLNVWIGELDWSHAAVGTAFIFCESAPTAMSASHTKGKSDAYSMQQFLETEKRFCSDKHFSGAYYPSFHARTFSRPPRRSLVAPASVWSDFDKKAIHDRNKSNRSANVASPNWKLVVVTLSHTSFKFYVHWWINLAFNSTGEI